MANEKFRFPDEVDDEVKVEVVDDTPLGDRDREPLPKETVEDLDNDDLEGYSARVRNRISVARKAYHDERRAKEQATREREAAIQAVQQAFQENQALKKRLGVGEQVFVHEVTRSAQAQLALAKENLTRAYEAGDADKITDAQEALTDAKLRIREVSGFQSSLQEQEPAVQTIPQFQAQPAPVVDAKAEAWRKNNDWFGDDPEMTAAAYGLHEKLLKKGVDPTSDKYYDEIDKTMRKRFPEQFQDEFDDTEREQRQERRPANRNSQVVTPATRSAAPRQVRLTSSQVAIANRLGLTPEAYAREVIKLENRNDR